METPSSCAFLDVSLHLWLSLPSLRNVFPLPTLHHSFSGFRGPASCWSSGQDPARPQQGVQVCQLGRKPRSHMQQCGYKRKKESFLKGPSPLGPLLSLSLLSLKHLLEAHGCQNCLVGGWLNLHPSADPPESHACVSLSVHRDLLHVPRPPRAIVCVALEAGVQVSSAASAFRFDSCKLLY